MVLIGATALAFQRYGGEYMEPRRFGDRRSNVPDCTPPEQTSSARETILPGEEPGTRLMFGALQRHAS